MARYLNLKKINELLEHCKFDPELPRYKNRLIQSSEIKNLPVLNNQFFLVFDISTFEILYLSNNIQEMMGYDPKKTTLPFIYSRILADDRNIVLTATEHVLKVCIEHPEIKARESSFEIDFRIRKSDGSIIRVLRKTCIYQKDKKGNPLLFLSLYTDITRYKQCDVIDVVVEGPDKPLFNFKNNCAVKTQNGKFTNKEIQILKGIAVGKGYKIIADEMNIKITTVSTHCSNMFDKFKLNKMSAILALAINEGYLRENREKE